ncbi:LLM class flavin-dependent oxidoreductase [Paenibacillus algorifonticola]|uniref:LLM class flavin-dependent oxidoreductase n=1 Tax=Paenibacillus algorifonticola TaxID=684063 RepID=UPI003D2E6FA9
MEKQTDGQQEQAAIEIGIYTLGDILPDPHTSDTISAKQRIQDIIAAAKLADEGGLDIFGLGEHHRHDFVVSATPVMLAAIARETERIRLTSATTVLSTVDPVRLFEDYATLDLVSDGRAEIIAGRGAFVESFPLFGYELSDYDELFSENLELFGELSRQDTVTWNGKHRPALRAAAIAPRPIQPQIPVWVGVGGSPQSAVRAGEFGLGMIMAILGGSPDRFKPLVDLYRETGIASGFDAASLKVGVTGHSYIAKDSQQARAEYFPYYTNYWSHMNRQRGSDFRITQEEFADMTAPDQALFVGSPEEIAEKMIRQHELFGHQRFIAQLDIGGIPYAKVAESIELLAGKVAPIVRAATKTKS